VRWLVRVELDAINTEREWHLRRAEELSAQMERSAVENVLVEAGGRTVAAVAREVLECMGWPLPPAD
jgi:hypothetical protein